MNVRTRKNWCAARTLHALHRLGPHLAQVRLPRLLFLMTTTREARWCGSMLWQCHKVKEGGASSHCSCFFCFRTHVLARAYHHGEEAQEAPHACRGGESGERALQLARRASGTLHNACTPFSCACTSPPPSGVDSRCGLGGAHGCSADAQRCLVRTIKFGFALTTSLLTLRALSPAFTSSALCMAQR